MTRIDATFRKLRAERKKAFVAFITAGYPDLRTTERLIPALAQAGVDIIELGVPFSDPIADGPVIQASSQAALARGVTARSVLALVSRVRSRVGIPLCVMTYCNPVFCFGQQRFCRSARAAGVDGLIVPDLPPEEAQELRTAAAGVQLDLIQFVAPTTTPERARFIARHAGGFIYYVSLTGTTGARSSLAEDVHRNLQRLKRLTSKPVCAGFGISTPAQVREVSRECDGVIVGSAIVKKIAEYQGKRDLIERTADFVGSLRKGL